MTIANRYRRALVLLLDGYQAFRRQVGATEARSAVSWLCAEGHLHWSTKRAAWTLSESGRALAERIREKESKNHE